MPLTKTLAVACVVFLIAPAAEAQNTIVRQALSKFITALQVSDYSIIVSTYEPCALEAGSIQQLFPKVLWSSKIADLRARLVASTKAEVSKYPGKIEADPISQDPYPELGVTLTTVPSELNTLFTFFPKAAMWRITELRSHTLGDGRVYFDAFVSVAYPSMDGAPKVGARSLAKTIIEFRVIGAPLYYVGNPIRIADADEFFR